MNKKIHKIISAALSVLICLTSLPFGVLADGGNQPREWFVSVDGSDTSGTGTKSNPFKTLQKGADMLEAGDTLYIRGGVYDEAFAVSASGTEDSPITIKNYNDEDVVIRATTKLTNWSSAGSNIWVTDMPWNMEDNGSENMLFNGEKSLILARYPNIPAGGSVLWPEVLYADFADRTSDYLGERGIIEDAELDMPDGYWDGGKVSIEAGLNWFNVSATIKSYTKGVLNLVDHDHSTSEYYDECPGDPYYIYDHLNALDAEDEFYFDRENNKMYFYSSKDPNKLEIGARSEKYIMDLRGQSYINVEGINMRGAPPLITNTHHINFEWIDLEALYTPFALEGEYNTLKHSHIYNGQNSLVAVSGRYNALFNCLIEYAGLKGKSAAGLSVRNTMYAYIGYNTVRYAGRTCAAFSGTNSIYEYNDFYGAGSLTHDTGPTYDGVNSCGTSEYRYNWVHDNYTDGANFGLYFDNSSGDIVIHHNVVWNSADKGEGELRKDGWVAYISNDPATGMSVYNNTFIGDAHMANLVDLSTNNRMMNNIFFGEIQSNVKFTAQRNNMLGWLDPKFVDMDNRDFRLTEESAAIDSGMEIEGITEGYVGNAPDLGAYEYGGEDWIPGHNFENPPVFEHKVPNYVKWHNVVANGGFEDDQDLNPELISTTRMFDPNYYGWSIMGKTEGQIDQEFSLYFNGKVNGEVRRTGNTGVRLGNNLNTAYPGDEAVEQSDAIIDLYREIKDNLSIFPETLSNNIPLSFYSLLVNSSNLFPNGDFEDSSYLFGVEAASRINTDEEAVSGTRSLKVYDMLYQWSGLRTSIPATTHRKFRLSLNFKPDIEGAVFQFNIFDHHPTDYDKVNDRKLASTYNKFNEVKWHSLSYDIDTNGPTSGIAIHSVYSNQKGGHYYVDDFAMLDITEAYLMQEAAANFPEAKAIIDEALANKFITSEGMALAVKNCAAVMLEADRETAIGLLVPILISVRNSRVSAGAGVTYTIDNLKPGREYSMHCSAWVKNLDDKVIFSVKHNGITLADYTACSSTWTEEYINFTAPENGDPVVIEIWKPHGKEAAYIDDVAVREYDPTPYRYRSTTQQLENLDMESEYMWPWYSLDGDLQLVETDKGQSLKVTDGRAMQDLLNLTVNETYTFYADFKLAMEDVESKEVQIVIHAIDNNTNGERFEYNLGKATITNDGWTRLSGSMEVLGYYNFNSVGFTAGLVDGEGTFLMDNVSVEKGNVAVTPVSYITSPDYIKLGDTELLYNDTIIQDGKKYIGFTIPKDYAGSIFNRGIIAEKDTEGPDGQALETPKYVEYYLTGYQYYKNSGKSLDDVLEETLPQSMFSKVAAVERRVSSGYWAGMTNNNDHFKAAYSYTKASLPTGNEMFKHGKYLASQMLDNPETKGEKQKAVTANVACVSDFTAYSSKVYSPALNGIVVSGVNTQYTEGSVFPTFYIEADILQYVKADLSGIGSNIKKYIVQNYTISQLKDIYTEEELKQIGFSGEVTGIKLDKTVCSLDVGDNVQLNADVLPLNNVFDDSIIWETDNPDVASVVDGLVTCNGYGTAKITVKSAVSPDKWAMCTIVAQKKVTDVTIDKQEIALKVGEKATLVASVLPADAANGNVIWESSDDDVAAVSQTGVVTAVSKGDATITVTTEDGGYTATCAVSVTTLFEQMYRPDITEGFSFVYDGKTFYYLNSVIDYDGKKYFKIFSLENWTNWAGDSYYLITERPEGGIYYTQRHSKVGGTDIQDMSKNLGVFGDYKIPADYEWNCGTVYYNSAKVKAYLKGSINVPSLSDYKYMMNNGISFNYDGSQTITSSLWVYNGSTFRNQFNGMNEGNSAIILSDDNTYYKGQNTAKYNFVTYISEDFFVENEIDLSTTGDVVLKAIADNISREKMSAGVWDDFKLQLIYDEQYAGEGMGLTATKELVGDDVTVNVVLHNNGVHAVGADSSIVMAMYSGDVFVGMKVVPVLTDVNANSITSVIPITLTETIPVTEIKVMLWDASSLEPVANSLTIK